MGQGLRRRPGHADPDEPGGAAAGPAARAGRRLPGRGARGRDGRRVRLLPARQGRRRAVDRHRDARAGRRRRTSTTCTPTRGSRWRPPRTGRSSPRSASATGWSWVPWRRPGFQLGLDIAAIKAANPQAIGVILGGHGITAWGDDERGGRGELAGDHPHARRRSSTERGSAEPFGAVVPGNEPLPEAERRAKAAAIFPTIRGLASDRPPAGRATTPTATSCWSSCRGRSSRRWPSWAPPARTTSCAPRSSRWSWTCPAPRRVEEILARLPELHAGLPGGLPGLLRPQRHPGLARRCAAPTRRSCWCPGVGHVLLRQGQADRPGGGRVLRQRDQRDARRGVGVDLRPDRGVGEVPHRVLGAGGGQARRGCPSPSRWPPGSRSSPARRRGSARPSRERLAAEGACVVVADLDLDKAAAGGRRDRATPTSAVGVGADVSDEDAVAAALAAARAGVRRGRPGGQQRRAVDLQAAAGDHRRATGTCSTT